MFKRLFAAISILLAVAFSTAIAQEKSTQDFIKYEPGTGLQIAVTDYVSPTTSQTVTLYGVVHIADKDYYQKVQKDLDGYDAVLYEGVGGDKKQMMEAKKKGSFLSAIQHLMGDVLDLDFQLESIDYSRENLVHADISADDLRDRMKDQDVTPLGQFLKNDTLNGLAPLLKEAGPLIKKLLKMQPELQNQLKDTLAKQMSEADVKAQFNEEFYNTIVVERNKIVIKVLGEQLKTGKKTFAVFYGAAHMPDLEKRLEKLGFKQTNKRWMTAWKLDVVKQADEDEDGGFNLPDLRKLVEPKKERPKQRRGDDRQKDIPDDEDK